MFARGRGRLRAFVAAPLLRRLPGPLTPLMPCTVVNSQFRDKLPGTIIVDPGNHFLDRAQNNGQAGYRVGVGGEGFGWSGTATVHTKQEWPDWYPPPEMLERKPEIRQHMVQLPSGGSAPTGGPDNPLGARASESAAREQGHAVPLTPPRDESGRSAGYVSSGCIRRSTNDDVADLYGRAPVGAKVVVLAVETPTAGASTTASLAPSRRLQRRQPLARRPAATIPAALGLPAIAGGRRDFRGCR